jgi:hypothetical protein
MSDTTTNEYEEELSTSLRNNLRIRRCLVGSTSCLAWHYSIAVNTGLSESKSDVLTVQLQPDARYGGYDPEGIGLALHVRGSWESHEFITVLQRLVDDLVLTVGRPWRTWEPPYDMIREDYIVRPKTWHDNVL